VSIAFIVNEGEVLYNLKKNKLVYSFVFVYYLIRIANKKILKFVLKFLLLFGNKIFTFKEIIAL